MISAFQELYSKNAKAGYTRFVDIYERQSLKYDEGEPDMESTRYHVVKITIVFIDSHYDKYNPRPTTKGDWVCSYSTTDFVYGKKSVAECKKFVDSQKYTVWSPN